MRETALLSRMVVLRRRGDRLRRAFGLFKFQAASGIVCAKAGRLIQRSHVRLGMSRSLAVWKALIAEQARREQFMGLICARNHRALRSWTSLLSWQRGVDLGRVESLLSQQLVDAQQATLAAQQQALDVQRAGGDASAAADDERLRLLDSIKQEAERQEVARKAAANESAVALERLRTEHAAAWREAKEEEQRVQQAHRQREHALQEALARTDVARGSLLLTLTVCIPPLEEVMGAMVDADREVRVVREGVEALEEERLESKAHVQKAVLHAATLIDEQRTAHELALADLREELRRKEQRIMEQWQELSRTNDEKVVNTRERVCQLEVQMGDERKQYEQMLADKDTSLRSMLADVQEHRRLLAEAGKAREIRERAHATRNAFKDWQVRRASAILTVLAHKSGQAKAAGLSLKTPGLSGVAVRHGVQGGGPHVPFSMSDDCEPPALPLSARRGSAPLSESWQLKEEREEGERTGLGTSSSALTASLHSTSIPLNKSLPSPALHQPAASPQRTPTSPHASASPLRAQGESERAGEGAGEGREGAQDEEEAAMFAQYRARRSKEIIGVFVGGLVSQQTSPISKGTDKGTPASNAADTPYVKSDEARTNAGRGLDGRGGGAESNVEMQARAHLEVVQSYIQGAQDRHL
jgi:hypothetical protein